MSAMLTRLVSLLKELFELDQPDLDFGMYRVLRLRSAEITAFLEESLPARVREAFGRHDDAQGAELRRELASAEAGARSLGMEPAAVPKVVELRAKVAAESADRGALESEVYDHLYRFFRRYYQGGDFVSRRVYKDGVYAIPYQGEEVLLHWANKDQYYIKTSEAFRNYSFRLRPARDDAPMRVHFDLVDADEGQHGNVKTAAGKERRFVLAAPGESGRDFVQLDGGELHIRFEYRKHPDSQDKLVDAAVAAILGASDPALTEWLHELGKAQEGTSTTPPPSKLAYRLRSYVARNQRDYFIHKDLGAFLRGELEYFLKSEVLHTDDLLRATSKQLEQRLSSLRVIREIGEQLITFLAQLEDFQKRLWLKKKFVTETSWCVTLDRIDERFWSEIAASDAQREAWVRLYAIDQIMGDLVKARYTVPLTPAFLRENRSLVLDTRHFSADFTARLLATFGDLDDATDGVLVHSENFQALSLLQTSLSHTVQCTYIDPPYNTGGDGFSYLDTYQHSSWLSMFGDRLRLARELLQKSGVLFFSISEIEAPVAWLSSSQVFGPENFASEFIWEKKKKPSFLHRNTGKVTELIFSFVSDTRCSPPFSVEVTTEGKMTPLNNAGNKISTLTFPSGSVRFGCTDMEYEPQDMSGGNITTKLLDRVVVRDFRNAEAFRLEGEWRYAQEKLDEVIDGGGDLYISKSPFRPNHIKLGGEIKKMKNLLSTAHYGVETNEDASDQLTRLFGSDVFQNPKPQGLVGLLIRAVTHIDPSSSVLDYFAGSGTTGHAVINLNREDGGRRKFILVEMADYFDTVLLPRLMKVTYSPEWDAGKPKRAASAEEIARGPGLVKVLRLESYEDTLNNLELRRPEGLDLLLSDAKEKAAYLVSSLLDTETRGSASLVDTNAFADPTRYLLTVKPPGRDESRRVAVDLVETLNLLLGLRVKNLDAPETFTALTRRNEHGRLEIERLKPDSAGPHWLRAVTGTDPEGRRVLVVWRRQTGDPELDNAVLDHWFDRRGHRTRDGEFDLIYVNGDCTLENLRRDDETWKVRRSEAELVRLMFEASEMARG